MFSRTINKNWYKIDGGVEYSTNFRFFHEHQISIKKEGKFYIVMSKLHNKILSKIKNPYANGDVGHFEIELKLKKLHKDLLSGKIYDEKGVFTN